MNEILLYTGIPRQSALCLHVLQWSRGSWCTGHCTTPMRTPTPRLTSRTERSTQTQTCMKLRNLEVPLGSKGRSGCHGCKCAQLDELFKQVAMLQEELNRQCSIWESERDINMWSCVLSQAEQQPCLKSLQREAKLASNPELTDSTNMQDKRD